MSAGPPIQPSENELTQNIVTSLEEYKDFQTVKGEKSGLEQKIDWIQEHNRELTEERQRNSDLRQENSSLKEKIRNLRSDLKSAKSRARQELKRHRIVSIVSTILIATGCSILASDITSGSLTWPGPTLVFAGLAVYFSMFLGPGD